MDLHCHWIFLAIRTGDKDLFLKAEVEYKGRTVAKTDPWVHNNFLLFAFVAGALTFGTDSGWIRSALAARSDTEPLSHRITASLSHYVQGQSSVTDRLKHIDLLMLGLLGKRDEMIELYAATQLELHLNGAWRTHSDSFVRTIVVAAENSLLKALSRQDLGPCREAVAFLTIFKKRVHFFATLLTWFILAGCLVWLFYRWYNAESWQGFVNDLSTWAGLAGVSAAFVYKHVVKWLEKFLRWSFGCSSAID